MANYDVLVTAAAPYHVNNLNPHAQLAMLTYARIVEAIAVIDFGSTVALQRTLVSKVAIATAGMPASEFSTQASPQEIAIWFAAGILGNATQIALSGASFQAKMTAISYLLTLSDDTLARISVFINGVTLGVLT